MTRKLDALVAERVMGLRVLLTEADVLRYCADTGTKPRLLTWDNGRTIDEAAAKRGAPCASWLGYYSERIADSFLVVEAMRAKGFRAVVDGCSASVPETPAWYCVFGNAGLRSGVARDDATPLAICLAALRAVGVSESEMEARKA